MNKFCCKEFTEAREDGTDNEGYLSAIIEEDNGKLCIGSINKPINFCPWCGNVLNQVKKPKTPMPPYPDQVQC